MLNGYVVEAPCVENSTLHHKSHAGGEEHFFLMGKAGVRLYLYTDRSDDCKDGAHTAIALFWIMNSE